MIRINEKGLTFIELVISLAVISIIASVALPLTKVVVKRTKEMELRRNLREIRQAIDKYKENYDKGLYGPKILGISGYPKTLDVLVSKKILRSIPEDPMIDSTDWGTCSYSDPAESLFSNKMDVYNVYTKNEEKAIDGTKYRKW